MTWHGFKITCLIVFFISQSFVQYFSSEASSTYTCMSPVYAEPAKQDVYCLTSVLACKIDPVTAPPSLRHPSLVTGPTLWTLVFIMVIKPICL